MEEHIIYKKDSIVNNAFNFNLNQLDRPDIPYVSLLKMRNHSWGGRGEAFHTSYVISVFGTVLCVKNSLELKVPKWKIKNFFLSQVSSVSISSLFSYWTCMELTLFVWNSPRGPAGTPTDLTCQSSSYIFSLIHITIANAWVLCSSSFLNAVGNALY